eukprot:2184673-Pleurochrysis_carterae.AAC.3
MRARECFDTTRFADACTRRSQCRRYFPQALGARSFRGEVAVSRRWKPVSSHRWRLEYARLDDVPNDESCEKAHLELGERAACKLAIEEYEKALELDPDNRTYKDALKDAQLTWEADWA